MGCGVPIVLAAAYRTQFPWPLPTKLSIVNDLKPKSLLTMAASSAPGRGDAIMAVEPGHVARPGSQASSSNSTDQDGSFPRSRTRTSAGSGRAPAWWKVRLFRGMVKDVRRRAPFYWSDWTDAWDYRVVPATVYMYFAKQVCPSSSQPVRWANFMRQYFASASLLFGYVHQNRYELRSQ